jgi:hypothetical protein
MVAIEAPSRRLELALYVMGQALQSFYSTFRIRGRMPYVKHGEVAIFVLSMAVIMHAYINKPRLMRSSYFAAFRFFFGSGGVKEGFPQADHARAHKKKLAQKIKSVQQQEQ